METITYNWFELQKSTNPYILRVIEEQTVTWSMIKYFLKWWGEAYYLKYVLWVEAPYYEEKEKRYFVVWQAFDDILRYWHEKWKEKYWIDTWLLVAELKELVVEKGLCEEAEAKGMKKDELQELYSQGRIRLTEAEWRDVIGMYREAMRQPDYDFGGDYERQKLIITKYQWLRISWTLDRFSEEKELIRDDKTTRGFDYFEYNLETKLWYLTSMAFYYMLAVVSTWKSCDVILDVLGKKQPYWYMAYRLTKEQLRTQVVEKIKPAFEALNRCIKTNKRESIYPIDYYTEDKYWNIENRKAGEPIPRTTLMNNEYYPVLNGTITNWQFIEPTVL